LIMEKNNHILIHRFLGTVKKYPDRPALRFSDREYTYGELHEMASSFEKAVRQLQEPSPVVAILAERSAVLEQKNRLMIALHANRFEWARPMRCIREQPPISDLRVFAFQDRSEKIAPCGLIEFSGRAQDDSGIPADAKLQPAYATNVPYGLSVSLNLHGGHHLKSVESPSHPIRIENMKADPVRVSFSSGEVRMDRDFVLNIAFEEEFKSRAYHHRREDESFLQLDLLLDQDDVHKVQQEEAGRGVVFVLDCSGSMSGDSIQQAKRALEICLKGLPHGVDFNICRFGASYEFLFERSEKYSETTLNKALGYLHRAGADLGGTEILDPLRAICSRNPGAGEDIILLTDGQIDNEQEIFEQIAEHRAGARVFPVGIGAGCNEHFIKGLARAGNGASEFIYPGERIEPKVLSLFGKVGQAGLENASIDWGAGEAEQAPFTPTIFLDSPVTVFARTAASDFTGKALEVKGKANGSERTWRIPVLEAMDDNLPIPTLWARERVRGLEESEELTGASGSRQVERKKESREKTILEICKRYGILSQSASYVAVEKRDERSRTTGELGLRKVPVLITVGWHGVGSLYNAPSVCQAFSAPPQAELFSAFQVSSRREMREVGLFPEQETSITDFQDVRFSLLSQTDAATDPREALVLGILSLQKARGGMSLDTGICSMLGIDLEQMRRDAKQIKTTTKTDKFVLLSTAVLLITLEVWFPGEFRTWSGVARKSRRWLQNILSKGSPELYGTSLMAWVDEFVRTRVSPRSGA